MSAPLTAAGEVSVAEKLAARYRVSVGAVRTLLDAVIRGGGSMAQFCTRTWAATASGCAAA